MIIGTQIIGIADKCCKPKDLQSLPLEISEDLKWIRAMYKCPHCSRIFYSEWVEKRSGEIIEYMLNCKYIIVKKD